MFSTHAFLIGKCNAVIDKLYDSELRVRISFLLGSSDLYGRLLREHECRGVSFYSPLYAATEGLIGVNLQPLADDRHYTMLPANMFFEFIPVDKSSEDQPATKLLHEVHSNTVNCVHAQ